MTNRKRFFARISLAIVLVSPVTGFGSEPPQRSVGTRLDHGVLSAQSTPPQRSVGTRLDHGVLSAQSTPPPRSVGTRLDHGVLRAQPSSSQNRDLNASDYERIKQAFMRMLGQ